MAGEKKQIEVKVDAIHMGHVLNCIKQLDAENITVAPVLTGYTIHGYWSLENNFSQIGKRVAIRFAVEIEPFAPFISSGFGILGRDIVLISVIDCGPAPARDALN
jgi:hypothetical protein